MTLARRFIAQTFLDDFQDTLVDSGKTWENALDEEEQRRIRKARRVKIGDELFMVGESKPFIFPAAFTFVFRAFTTLDGIGKVCAPCAVLPLPCLSLQCAHSGRISSVSSLRYAPQALDKNYDVARLAQPFLKELADLKDGSVITTLAKTWGKRLGWRPEDIGALVTQPRRVSETATTMNELRVGPSLPARQRA